MHNYLKKFDKQRVERIKDNRGFKMTAGLIAIFRNAQITISIPTEKYFIQSFQWA